jgi:hypothetical protein
MDAVGELSAWQAVTSESMKKQWRGWRNQWRGEAETGELWREMTWLMK